MTAKRPTKKQRRVYASIADKDKSKRTPEEQRILDLVAAEEGVEFVEKFAELILEAGAGRPLAPPDPSRGGPQGVFRTQH